MNKFSIEVRRLKTKGGLLVWYFVDLILLPSSTGFALLAFFMKVSRSTLVAPIAGGHIARARLGVFQSLHRHRNVLVEGMEGSGKGERGRDEAVVPLP